MEWAHPLTANYMPNVYYSAFTISIVAENLALGDAIADIHNFQP